MMLEYLFLFVLAFVWIVFAVVQDLKTREISNWINFSLIAFVLVYRTFYSLSVGSWDFLLFGIGGIILFVILGYVFYYTKVFAGGDAKLLFGIGGVLPFESLKDYLILGGGYILLLFLVGVIYSLIYTTALVFRKGKEFRKDFFERIRKGRILVYISFMTSLLLIVFYYNLVEFYSFVFLIFLLFPFLYFYVKSVEKVCMIKEIAAEKLMEGDWLEQDIKVGKKWIRKSVHGLSIDEIKLLRKARKKVLIKEGVPFSPAFLLALLFFAGYFFLR